MSLKNIGELGNNVKLINGFSGISEILENLGKNGSTAFYAIRDSLDGLNIDDATKKLKDLKINPELATEILESANSMHYLRGSADDIADGIKNVSKESVGLGVAFKGLAATIKSAVFNPLTWVAIGAAVLTGALILNATAFDRSIKNAQESQSVYLDSASSLSSMNSELETTSKRIEELQALKDAGTISVADENELTKLKLQNAELQRQIDLQKQIVSEKSKEAVQDAVHSLEMNRTADSTQVSKTVTDDFGVEYNAPKQTTLIEATTNELAKLAELKDQKKQLLQEYADISTSQSRKDDINNELQILEGEIFKYNSTVSEQINNLNILRESFLDENGLMKEGLSSQEEGYYKIMTEIIDDFNNIDLSPAERSLKKLDRFFDGSKGKNFIKEDLMDAVDSTEDLEKALQSMGLSLDDIGVDNIDTLKRYLDEAKSSAEGATEAVKGLAETENIGAVTTALETQNAGYNYEQAVSHAEKIKELYDKGLVGTDDFKSFADYMSYGSDDSIGAYEAGIEKFNRYFTTDSASGVKNFLDDLIAKSNDLGKSWATWNEEDGYKFDIDNLAEVAKEMGIGVGEIEDIFGRLQDHDFDIDIRSAIEDLNTYKTSLDGIKEIYDKMGEGTDKDRLGKLIENWDEEYAGYENDLATLTEDQVVRIKFEYDLASIQAEIDKLKEEAWALEGSEKNKAYAQIIAGNNQIIDKQEEQYNVDEIKIPVGLETSKQSIADLRNQVENATGEEKIQLEAKLINAQELHKSILSAFGDANPTITPDTDPSIVQQKWDEFFNTPQNLSVDAELEPAKIEEQLAVMQDGSTITFKADINEDGIEDTVTALKEGNEITYTADIDGAKHKIEEIKEQEGILTYTVDDTEIHDYDADMQAAIKYVMDSQEEPESKNAMVAYILSHQEDPEFRNALMNYIKSGQQDPEARQALLDYIKSHQEPADDQNATVDYQKGTQQEPDSPVDGTVNWGLGSVDWPNLSLTGVINWIRGGGSDLEGTAHKDGTFSGKTFKHGTLEDDSFIKDDWKTKRDDVALTGELGQEIVVHGNHWWTVGDNGAEFSAIPKDSVVFNARQTKQLLKNGKINERGRAMLEGTAYAGSSIGGGKFQGGTSGYNPGSGSTYIDNSVDNSTTNNNVNLDSSNSGDSTEDLKPEKFDWIEKLLSRIQRAITKLGKVATSTFKPWKERTDALGEQISKVTEEMTKQQEAYDRYMQEAESVGLSEEYKNKIKDGTIDIESITDEDLKEKIKEFEKWYELALDCEDAVQDLDEELSELAVQKFDDVFQQYEDKLSVIEHQINMLDSSISQVEEKGYIVGESYYKNAIEQNKSYLELLKKQRNDLKATLNEGVASGKISMYSEEWYDLMGQIHGVDEAIKETDSSIISLNKDLQELDWDIFDRLLKMMSGVTSEGDFLNDLMSNDKMFNEETGAITNQGQATLGVHAVNYNAYMAQSEEYGKEIQEIDKQLAEDPYNVDLLERREELIDSQRDMIGAAEDEKQAMKELVSDGYDVFLDIMDKAIQKHKKMMNDMKDLSDFEKKISKQVKEIADLEKMLQAYSGDTSEEGKTFIQKTQLELEEARENLEESQYDKYISDQEQILDQLYSEAEAWINSRLDNLDSLVQGVIDSTNENAESIKETLQNEADSVGIKLSESMNNIWSTNGDGYGSVVTTYCEGFTNKLTTTNTTLDQIRLFIAEMVAKADADAKNDIDNQNNQHESDTSDPTPPVTPTPTPPAQEQPSKEVSVGGLIDAGGAKIYAHPGGEGYTQYFANDPIYTVLAEKDGYVQVRWHNTPDGVTGWFNKSDIKAYKKGGLVDYTGLAQLDGTPSEPEMVLNAEDTKNFMDLKDALVTYTKDGRKLTPIDPSKLDPNFYKAIQSGELLRSLMPNNLPMNYAGISGIDNLPVPNSNVQIQQGDIHIGDIQMYGVQDPQEFAKQLRYTLVNDRQTTKIIQAKTVGAMAGRGSLEATKYMF